jgi:hypothetical protein
VALFWLAYLLILFAASIPKGMAPPGWGQLVWGAVSSLALVGLTLVLIRREGRSAADVGLGRAAVRALLFAVGLLIGCALMAVLFGIAALLSGPMHVTAAPIGLGAVVLNIATFVALAVMEEVGFRGYPLRTLAPAFGVWPAQAVVAIAFAATHLLYGWALSTVLLGVLPSALLFGVAAIVSRGLALPIGLHLSLNLAQWATGAKGGGLCTVTFAGNTSGWRGAAEPWVGCLVTLTVAAALWVYYPTGAVDRRLDWQGRKA